MALPTRVAVPRRSSVSPPASRRSTTRPATRTSTLPGARTHAIDPLARRMAGPRPMVRATVGILASPAPKPTLTVVPRRRRAARFLGVLCALIVLAMLGAASFQTLLAQRQLELDRLDQEIVDAREQYEVLRQERAELRSPQRLAGIATAAGMIPTKQSSFVSLSPELMAVVQESVGPLGVAGTGTSSDPLEQFRIVKSLTSTETP